MNKKQKILLLIMCLLLFIGMIGLDMWSKHWIRTNLPIDDYYSWLDVPIAGEWLAFTHVENTGVAFSIPIPMLKWVSVFAFLFILYFFYRIIKENPNAWVNFIAFTLILAGAVGNNIDRFTRGPVTDFIKVDFGFWPFNPFAIFNVADSCITVGVFLYIIYMIVTEIKLKRKEKNNT